MEWEVRRRGSEDLIEVSLPELRVETENGW